MIDYSLESLYSQNIQYNPVQTGNTEAAAKAAENQGQGTEAVDGATSQAASTDRLELSREASIGRKMTDAERADLIQSLKADQENQMIRFTNMMMGIFNQQGITGLTAGSDAFWRTIASGNYTVDAKTKAEAQETISEDGYWGVKKTSQRIFDFAYAIAGDDVDKMREMQEAVEKGFEAAGGAWGGALPEISGQTYDAVGSLFDSYYAQYEEQES